MAYIELKDACKEYNTSNGLVKAINKINIKIEKGQLIVIKGPSGSGKTTLLNVIGAMDKVTSGTIIVDGQTINNLKEKKLSKYRKDKVSFVFQSSCFLNDLTVMQNIDLSSNISKSDVNSIDVINKVGLSKKENLYPDELTSEDKKRLKIAIALAKKAPILIIDEITTSMSKKGIRSIIKIIKDILKDCKTTIIISTNCDELDSLEKYATFINLSGGNIKCKTKKNKGDTK